MKPNIRITAARLAALLVLAALLGAGVQAAVAAEQTLTMSIGNNAGIGTDPNLDNTIWPDIGGMQQYHYYTHYSPLITLDSDGKIAPYMAESYEVSDDYKTITFHLRKGIKFADGTPLNASVLKFNFDRIMKFGWNDWAVNRTKVSVWLYYDSSEAVDDYTFKIHFTNGWQGMPLFLAAGHMLGKFISPLDVDPAWDFKGMLKHEKMYNGLGAYYVDENESIPNQKVVLVRRHSWRDDLNFHKPMLDRIVLTLIKDPQTAVMALEKGDIDYICRSWNAPLDTLPKLEKNPKITIKTSPDTLIYLLRTAYWKEPFIGEDGILLRKAICYALNRTELVEGAFNGYAVPATDCMYLSPKRSDVPECCGKGYDYDPDKSKQLLAEAGWNDTDGDGFLDKNGITLKDLDLVITSASMYSWQKDLALVVQSQLKKIGIGTEIRTLESSDYNQAIRDREYDLAIGYDSGTSNPLFEELNSFNRKKGEAPDLYENQNGSLKMIVEKAQTTLNKGDVDKSLCQVCEILHEEAGVIPLVHPMVYAVMNSRVKGFELTPYYFTPYLDHVEECWIED